MNLIEQIKHARAVGAPLIALSTPDQPAATALIQAQLTTAPLIEWDIVRGHRPLNEPGAQAIAKMLQGRDAEMGPITNVTEMLSLAEKLPADAFMIIHQAWLYLEDPGPRQALLNLREDFKSTSRTILLLGPDFRLPPELAQDILCLDDPLPSPETIRAILTAFWKENDVSYAPELLERCTGALRGLAAFPAEQASALSLEKRDGKLQVNVGELWARKRKTIEQVPGLTMVTSRFTFDDIGGLVQWIKFATGLYNGRKRFSCVVWLEEIEKMLPAGAGGFGDSGVSADQLGTTLTLMELYNLVGATFVGPGGSGKSLAAEATAATFDVPCFRFDFGALKNQFVGNSEKNVRFAWNTIYAVGGSDCLVLTTSNGIEQLPPALKRRLARRGIWYFDLPEMNEREAIAKIQVKRNQVDDKKAIAFFKSSEGWSGANIRDCCETAYALNCSVKEAAEFITPAAIQEGDGLARIRNSAAGKYLSASYPGLYHLPTGVAPMPEMKVRRVGMIAEVEETPEKPKKEDLN